MNSKEFFDYLKSLPEDRAIGILDDMNKEADRMADELNKRDWISVKDRLPTEEDADENGKVLLYRTVNQDQKAQAKSIYDWQMVKHCDEDAFWQPLPPLPEGE